LVPFPHLEGNPEDYHAFLDSPQGGGGLEELKSEPSNRALYDWENLFTQAKKNFYVRNLSTRKPMPI
jgi:hypothetical protein